MKLFPCSYTTDEIHFNLMAIVADRKRLFEKEIKELEEKRDAAAQRVRMGLLLLIVCWVYI